jgi:GMP synthase (glutamine-hydrolysing)
MLHIKKQKENEMSSNRILIIDFGGQYNQLIARRVRECGVYSEVKGFESVTLDEIREFDPKGIIFTGGPQSAYGEGAPSIDDGIFELGVPVLGICYGAQLMAYRLGGRIESAPTSEYGHTVVNVTGKDGILKAADDMNVCWMSHTDYIVDLPDGFEIIASSKGAPAAAVENRSKKLFAVQFHPEVSHTVYGKEIIKVGVPRAKCIIDTTKKKVIKLGLSDFAPGDKVYFKDGYGHTTYIIKFKYAE